MDPRIENRTAIFEKIQELVLDTDFSTVTLDKLDVSKYREHLIVCACQSSGASDMAMYFNDDGNSNNYEIFDRHIGKNDGGTETNQYTDNSFLFGNKPNSNPAGFEIKLIGNRPIAYLVGTFYDNANPFNDVRYILNWKTPADIKKVVLDVGTYGGVFITGSVFTLYGMR